MQNLAEKEDVFGFSIDTMSRPFSGDLERGPSRSPIKRNTLMTKKSVVDHLSGDKKEDNDDDELNTIEVTDSSFSDSEKNHRTLFESGNLKTWFEPEILEVHEQEELAKMEHSLTLRNKDMVDNKISLLLPGKMDNSLTQGSKEFYDKISTEVF